ncbi:group I truncated hemoglobin [Solimicrobium silvestre]|uniref:Bacterial-like globin n=1 Tax=Solimicrobium silvestre TaxID=2099400 RepID=A0A2S9GSQ7_9BURK|nr:group 1 truncated hemoglobin [Solimicrobium silvestre]PRC90743.1 Bacterial-like globin [Solimicrobium silvestre]
MKRFFQSTTALFTLLMSATLMTSTAYAQSSPAPVMNAEKNDAVFQSFGGKAGISKIIDDFLVIWHADPRISAKLEDADVPHLALLLKEQITHLTGGPGVYSGKDMKTVHDGMNLRNVDFNALTEDLQHAMDKNDVPSRAQNKLLAKLAPMQHDIVTK